LRELALVMLAIACGKNPPAKMPSATIDRPGYMLRYPSAWKLDTADKDFDLDRWFSIDINDGCHESFYFFDSPIEPKTGLQAQVDIHLQDVFKPGATVERFTRWGAYTGEGALMRGKLRQLDPGTVRVFAVATASRSLHVIEFCFDEDLAAAQPGLALVESSLRLK
jgi:hypothetical protein